MANEANQNTDPTGHTYQSILDQLESTSLKSFQESSIAIAIMRMPKTQRASLAAFSDTGFKAGWFAAIAYLKNMGIIHVHEE